MLKKKQNSIFKDCGITTKGITYLYWKYQKEKIEKNRKKYLKVMTEFP